MLEEQLASMQEAHAEELTLMTLLGKNKRADVTAQDQSPARHAEAVPSQGNDDVVAAAAAPAAEEKRRVEAEAAERSREMEEKLRSMQEEQREMQAAHESEVENMRASLDAERRALDAERRRMNEHERELRGDGVSEQLLYCA